MKAQDIMTRDVVTVGPDTSIPEIANIMVEKHITGVPVVTDRGEIIGMRNPQHCSRCSATKVT